LIVYDLQIGIDGTSTYEEYESERFFPGLDENTTYEVQVNDYIFILIALINF